MSDLNHIKSKAEKFLTTLCSIVDRNVGVEASTDRIFKTIGMHFEGKGDVLKYLADERLVSWSDSSRISLTHKGLIHASKLLETTYAEREGMLLQAVYEMANRQPQVMVLISDLAKAVEMSQHELIPILNDLENRKQLIGGIEEAIWITPKGIEHLERQRGATMERSYRDKEYSVLKTLVERDEEISSGQLVDELSLSDKEIEAILLDFKGKGWVHLSFGYTAKITPAGRSAYYKWDEKPTPLGNVNYNVTNYGNAQIWGQGNSQYIQQTNNPDFDKAIRSIIEMLSKSSLSDDDKEEAITDIQAIHKLAVQAPANAFERAKLKITAIETIVKGTELAVKLEPYWPMILEQFKSIAG